MDAHSGSDPRTEAARVPAPGVPGPAGRSTREPAGGEPVPGAAPFHGLEIEHASVVYRSRGGSRRARTGTEADGGDVIAVDDVTLRLPTGRILALLGPSGCGKSSLLRAVAGLEDLAAGTVRWDGEDVVGLPVHKRGFGLMFQDGQLFPFRDVAGNVAYGIERMPRRERMARVEEMLELVGLPGYGSRQVTTLSGGQAQRVALARSLAPSPRLLLLDEPLSALDRAMREQLAVDLREILAAQGTTALYVTHDHGEAATVADEVGVMSAGRLLALGTMDELRAHPGSEEVAAFLGLR